MLVMIVWKKKKKLMIHNLKVMKLLNERMTIYLLQVTSPNLQTLLKMMLLVMYQVSREVNMTYLQLMMT